MRLYNKLPSNRKELFPMIIGRGVEPEVGDMLYALIRMTKPQIAIETGTYVADSSVRLAEGVQANGFGHFHTCDTDPKDEAKQRLSVFPSTTFHYPKRGIDLLAEFPIMDFVFIDSGQPKEREEELMTLGEHNISPLGIVCWHDACFSYENMYNAFAPARDWPHIIFSSNIGLAVFQRPE